MIDYDPRQPLISLHIPKTAGTSFRRVLEDWFGEGFHPHYPSRTQNPPRIEAGPGDCIHGHFNVMLGAGARDYYPEVDQFIVVLRDPFDRMVSDWLFKNKVKRAGAHQPPDLADDPTFEVWYARLKDALVQDPTRNPMLRMMPEPVTPDGFADLLERRFVAIGVTERLDDTVRLFARRLGKPELATPRDNVTGAEKAALERWRDDHRESFPAEHAAYAIGRATFEREFARAFG